MSAKYAFTNTLREIRFLFCQTSAESQATRSFLARAYPTMKKNNPEIPIMMRDAQELGKEKSESLAGLSEKEVEERVTGLVKAGI